MDTSKHTPTPWKAVEHNWSTIGIYAEDERCGGTVAVLDIQAEATEETQAELETWMAANADFIVRACNSHDHWAKWIVQRGPGLPDHACAECVPGGDIVKAGFQCVYHEALTAAGAV